MASRICVHVVTDTESSRSNRARGFVRHLEVVDHDIDVELLRPSRVGPHRWLVVGRKLEGEARRLAVLGNHHPLIGLVGDRQAEELAVDESEHSRIATVDHYVVRSADRHGAPPPALSRPNRARAIASTQFSSRGTDDPDLT
jgi:hypothetical protein